MGSFRNIVKMLGKIIRTAGHLYCTLALFLASLLIELFEYVVRKLVSVVITVTGIEKKNPKPLIQLYSTEPVLSEKHFLDEKIMLSKSDFPIKPAELVEKCKNIVHHKFGAEKPDALSEDFQFIFPVVGPLPKGEFIEAFSSFKVEEAFSGNYNYFGFNVDPMEPNRVWFFSRGVVTHTGVLGGVFGLIHAIGGSLPFPEGKPWKPSLRWEAFSFHVPSIGNIWKRGK